MATAATAVTEAQAYEYMIELFTDILSGMDGAVERFHYLAERTNFLPENRNFVTALEDFLEEQGLRFYVFAQRKHDIIRIMHERTKDVLPEGRRILDKYRAWLRERSAAGKVNKGRKP